jgi:hypothetical protein
VIHLAKLSLLVIGIGDRKTVSSALPAGSLSPTYCGSHAWRFNQVVVFTENEHLGRAKNRREKVALRANVGSKFAN